MRIKHVTCCRWRERGLMKTLCYIERKRGQQDIHSLPALARSMYRKAGIVPTDSDNCFGQMLLGALPAYSVAEFFCASFPKWLLWLPWLPFAYPHPSRAPANYFTEQFLQSLLRCDLMGRACLSA